MAHTYVNWNRGPVPRQESLDQTSPAAKSHATSTCLQWRLPLKCHSAEEGTRFCVRKVAISRSPLTESNRRPSPYHVPPAGSVIAGRTLDQREHEHRPAPTSPRMALASTMPLNLPLSLILPPKNLTVAESRSSKSCSIGAGRRQASSQVIVSAPSYCLSSFAVRPVQGSGVEYCGAANDTCGRSWPGTRPLQRTTSHRSRESSRPGPASCDRPLPGADQAWVLLGEYERGCVAAQVYIGGRVLEPHALKPA